MLEEYLSVHSTVSGFHHALWGFIMITFILKEHSSLHWWAFCLENYCFSTFLIRWEFFLMLQPHIKNNEENLALRMPPTPTPISMTRATVPAGTWNMVHLEFFISDWITEPCHWVVPALRMGNICLNSWKGILRFDELDFPWTRLSNDCYPDYTAYHSEHLWFVSENISFLRTYFSS